MSFAVGGAVGAACAAMARARIVIAENILSFDGSLRWRRIEELEVDDVQKKVKEFNGSYNFGPQARHYYREARRVGKGSPSSALCDDKSQSAKKMTCSHGSDDWQGPSRVQMVLVSILDQTEEELTLS